MGALLCIVVSALDIVYAIKVEYMTKVLFYLNCGVILLRVIGSIYLGQHHDTKNKSLEETAADSYKLLHILYYTGFYRLLKSS